MKIKNKIIILLGGIFGSCGMSLGCNCNISNIVDKPIFFSPFKYEVTSSNFFLIVEQSLPDFLKPIHIEHNIRITKTGMLGETTHLCVLVYKKKDGRDYYVNSQCDAMVVFLEPHYIYPDQTIKLRYESCFVSKNSNWTVFLINGLLSTTQYKVFKKRLQKQLLEYGHKYTNIGDKVLMEQGGKPTTTNHGKDKETEKYINKETESGDK